VRAGVCLVSDLKTYNGGRTLQTRRADAVTSGDRAHMRRAIELATRGLGRTAPNPAVGCVIVKDGQARRCINLAAAVCWRFATCQAKALVVYAPSTPPPRHVNAALLRLCQEARARTDRHQAGKRK